MPKFDSTKASGEWNGSSYLEAGIYDNLTLTEIRVDKSKNGNNFIAFYFSDPNNNTVPKTEWEPKGEGEELERKEMNIMERINHIAINSGLFTHEEFVIQADSFSDYIRKVKEKFETKKDKWPQTKLRIKVVYDDNDYTTLPRYTKYTWLESMDIPKEQSKIKIIPNIDKMNRSNVSPDTNVPQQSNPFESGQLLEDAETKDKVEAPF